MNKLKTYIITGIIYVSIVGTLMHFVYIWSGQNAFVGLFAPVNESTWEHMKLLFFPMLSYYLFLCKKLKTDYPYLSSGFSLGTLVGTFLIPVLFYTYSGILGFNLAIIDIAIFYISVLIAFYVFYKSLLSSKVHSYKIPLNVLCIIVAICFLVFTYFPPDIALYVSP